jgi:WD40 repeat protein
LGLDGWWSWTTTPDKSAIISCNPDGSVSKWTGPRFEREEKLLQFEDTFHRGCLTSDGNQVAVSYADGAVKLWDVSRRQVDHEFKVDDGPMFPVRFLAGGEKLQVVDDQGRCFVWDWAANKKARSLPSSRSDWLFARDGSFCLSSSEGRIALDNLLTGERELLPETWKASFRVGRAALSADARYLAASTYETGELNTSEVNVWDLRSRKAVGTYGRFVMSAHSVNFSPDVKRLVAASGGFEAVKLWDFESQQELLTLQANGGSLSNVAFSLDGDMISANDDGGTVYCWRAPSWEEIEAADANQGK